MQRSFWYRDLVGVTTALLLATACGGGDSQTSDGGGQAVADNAAQVTVAIARLDTLRDPLLLTGLVVPATSGDWTIYAPEAGLLAQVTKTVGDPVAAGELLVRFDVLSISQQIETNRMLLAQAERRRDDAFTERDRLQSLFDRGLVARNEVTNHRIEVTAAEGAVAQAAAELKVASLQEEATRVTARFDGIVAALWKAEGDFVTGTRDDPVMRVVDPTRTQVVVHVPVDQSARLSAGQIVTVSTTGGVNAVGEVEAPEGPLPGSVVRVSMPTDPAEPRAEVRLDYQREEPLALETAVRVEILLEQRADAIVVPVEAVRRDEGGAFVFIAGEDLVAHRRDVRVGLVVGPLAQIIQGVSAGDRVIVSGGETVQDGQAIRVGR